MSPLNIDLINQTPKNQEIGKRRNSLEIQEEPISPIE